MRLDDLNLTQDTNKLIKLPVLHSVKVGDEIQNKNPCKKYPIKFTVILELLLHNKVCLIF